MLVLFLPLCKFCDFVVVFVTFLHDKPTCLEMSLFVIISNYNFIPCSISDNYRYDYNLLHFQRQKQKDMLALMHSKSDSCIHKYHVTLTHTHTHRVDVNRHHPGCICGWRALLSSNRGSFHSRLHWWISTGELHDPSVSFTQKLLHLQSFKDITSHRRLQESWAEKLRGGKCLMCLFCCQQLLVVLPVNVWNLCQKKTSQRF